MEYIELNGGACSDCTIAIANSDYSGMDDAQEQATRAGIEAIGQYLIVGDEMGFCHDRCVICGGLAGDRHKVGYLAPARPKVQLHVKGAWRSWCVLYEGKLYPFGAGAYGRAMAMREAPAIADGNKMGFSAYKA
jgi:hypothetical protein